MPSAARWHATRRPSGMGSSGGSTARQRSCTKGQRDAKRHPSGTASGARQVSGQSGGGDGASGWDRGMAEKARRIGMRRACEQRVGIGDLDDASEIHHGDAVGDVPHDREIVRDEQVGQFQLALQILQEIDDLRLDGDIESRYRLVADDETRLQREGASDADALALPAGELMRIACVAERGRRTRSSISRTRGAAGARSPIAMDDVGLGDRIADRHAAD